MEAFTKSLSWQILCLANQQSKPETDSVSYEWRKTVVIYISQANKSSVWAFLSNASGSMDDLVGLLVHHFDPDEKYLNNKCLDWHEITFRRSPLLKD